MPAIVPKWHTVVRVARVSEYTGGKVTERCGLHLCSLGEAVPVLTFTLLWCSCFGVIYTPVKSLPHALETSPVKSTHQQAIWVEGFSIWGGAPGKVNTKGTKTCLIYNTQAILSPLSGFYSQVWMFLLYYIEYLNLQKEVKLNDT